MTKEEFSELFPKKEIKYKDNVVITVRPIAMAVMPEIIDTLKNIISLVKDDTPPQQLAFSAFDDLVKLIPHSVKTDLKEIPGTFLPEVLQAIIELNLNETVLKNWLALLETVGNKMDELGGEEEKQDSGKQ